MKSFMIIALSICVIGVNSMFCNYFPLDPIACVQKTAGVQCYFNQFENACIETESTSHGCLKTLNEMACLNQLTDSVGKETGCHFGNKCTVSSSYHLKNLGCSSKFSKYACTNVTTKDCFWNGNQCDEYHEDIPSAQNCADVFNTSVTPSLCTKIKNLKCMNGGIQNQYFCVDVTDTILSTLQCTVPGINEQTCISITTNSESCIFYKGKCQNSLLITDITKCSSSLNRLGCLNIANKTLSCQWKQGKCQDFIFQDDQECSEIKEVNEVVCANQKQQCQYDAEKFVCIKPANIGKVTCNSRGLTKELCLTLTNQYCTYFNGYCEEIKLEDLHIYQCEMQINRDACVNLQTKYQFCKWDGTQCLRITMNQDLDCETQTLVNGNVCQSISKQDSLCKYDQKTHNCIKSSENDFCNSPFLNLFGCININRPGLTCQWTINGCLQIKVKQFETICDSLGFANPNACSQIFEDAKTGCYFDMNVQQCKSFKIENSIDLLNNLECTNAKFGLNKIACASITKQGMVCRWYQNQCMQIRKKVDVAQVECLKMQYVNQQACALIEFGKEPCRYLQSQLGCVNSLVQNLQCDYPGLNTYACSQASGSCYFDTNLNICKVLETGSTTSPTQITQLLSNMECISSSPTKDVCKQITTNGQLCSWSIRQTKCIFQSVLFNQSCSTYYGTNITVNANVCSSIEMDFPDYDIRNGPSTDVDRGYCKFNPTSGNCEKNGDLCSTPCCSDKVGINSHSCSRFSKQIANVYCYFSNDLKCTQLTGDVVDIYNESAVKNYYNANQMKCSQMNRLSCHMIEWSTKQLCYHNGKSCINLNYANYGNYDVFIQSPAILNKWACLAIDASITSKNTLKYFIYNVQSKRCQVRPSEQTYSTCDQAVGNRNVCLGLTNNLLCKWNTNLLKCQEITSDEYDEIYTCSYNQNKKACIENPNTSCQFSLINDRCIDAPTDVDCDYFDTNGPISSNVCVRITGDKAMCRYNQSRQSCDNTSQGQVNGCNFDYQVNSITCFKKTVGQCRWDPNEYVCYENQDDISTLGCEDNLNYYLCIIVTKEPCVWDESKYKCLKQTLTDASNIVPSNYYNRLACYNVTGGGYIHQNNFQCLVSNSKSNYQCQEGYLNEYACLFLTQGHNCYYDKIESPLTYRCKPFTDIQTKCSTDTLINIDVCMSIPQTCLFNVNTLRCVSTTISETQTCTGLQQQLSIGYYYNRMSCASISEYIDSTDGDRKCKYQIGDKVQQCNYEKNCYYSSYTCYVWKPIYNFVYDPNYKQQVTCDKDVEGPCYEYIPVCFENSLQTKISQCSNNYSKALCLQMVEEQCYFDLGQGGCNSLSGNEHKLPDCTSIVNNCNVSLTPQIVCQTSTGNGAIQPGNKCMSVQRSITKCMNNGDTQLYLSCSDYSSISDSIICASATDDCRLDGGLCSSNPPSAKQDGTYTCDKSMSQTMCESLNCNYAKLGFCQQTESVLQKNSTNSLYLCYEVNLLKIQNKNLICAQIDASCIYTNKCEDCTGCTCSQLLNNVVSFNACISCKGLQTQYDSTKYLCNKIMATIDTCDQNLNYNGCMINTKDQCKWLNNSCTTITDLTQEVSTDCTIYNQIACIKITQQNCYIDKTTQLCQPLDSTQVGCLDIQQQSICQKSFKENCQWNTTKTSCDPVTTLDSTYTCELANKFGCLNMLDKTCGWSIQNNQCFSFQFKSSINSCSNFVLIDNQNTDNKLVQFNPISCSQINIDQICFNDVSNKCRQAVSADVITCTTPGLNKYGCITRATGKCQYSLNQKSNFTECNSTDKTDLGCSNLLNLDACLNQDSYCKFQNNQCQVYDVQNFSDIVATDKFPYSIKVCQVFTVAQSIIYSFQKKRCVKATLRDPFITKCDQQGINKYACLNKTTGFCQYDDSSKQCKSITKDQLNKAQQCNSIYNWYSCISLNLKCKFINNLCQSVGDNEKCSDLATNKALVNSLVCSTRTNGEACKLDSVLNQCVLINGTSEICTAIGLNQQGCIHNTKGSLCLYLDNQCVDNFNNLQCTDIINEDKCYSIRTSGNYCIFNQNGCGNIDKTTNDLTKCLKTFKTNPLTCSLSTDIPCFYDKTTNKCSQYSQPNKDSDMQLYDWSNNISFNQQACQQYNENNLAVYWQDQCLEIPSSQFQYLTCTSLVNKLGCLSITNQSQYCQFNTKCENADLKNYINHDCSQITNINTLNFCEVNNVASVKCEFDSTLHTCKVSDQDITQCENKGYNKYACAQLNSCQFNNNRCYQINDGIKQFCNDATQINCNTVIKEGCDLQCKSIQSEQYQQLNCEQTLNAYGCARISKKDQYCHFGQSCVYVQPQNYKIEKCVNIKNINNQLFCEQPKDIACIFDIENRQCSAVKSSDTFSCIRGINKLACLNQTNSQLNCQFFDYCFGPNDKLLKCKPLPNEDPNGCCQNASSIESCLFQTLFNCQWDNNSCKPFTYTEQDCNSIINKSKNVCTKQQSSVCILNSSLFKCESINPTTCDQAQTVDQCLQVQNVPCYWNKIEQECEYKESQSVDQCEDILTENGNMAACLMITRQGQLCQFKNNQCLTYLEDKLSDNCLNNINQIACTQQQSSFCYWKQLNIKIKKTQWSDESDLQVGQCAKFDQFQDFECDENLSYLSCLNILNKGKQCRWTDNICQQIQYSKNDVFSTKSLLLVNSNACGLINSGELVQYNSITNTCKKISNIDSITCFPFTEGVNKLACLKIRTQQCYWDDKNNQCLLKSRILVEHQLQKIRLLQQGNCKIAGIGPTLCRQINYDLPCASVDDGCDQIDINTATCETLGLNKYGCLHVITGPCIWIKDDETNLNSNYHCEEYYPFGVCTDVPQNVNSLVCSYVEEDACEYNNITKSCQTPQTIYNTCQISGINAVGCSKITGCIFQNQNCVDWNDSYNLLCSEATNANASVCQQAIDRCKFSELTSGCIASTITDNCYTSGLSALGCNVLDQCKWSNNQCQCIAYLDQFPQCDTLTEYTKCQNKEYCYFEVSSQNASKDLTQYLKNTNFGTCRDKQCSDLDINKCNNTKINNILCYLNISQVCKSSQKCEDIINPSQDCSKYIINNQSCKWNKNLKSCETLNCNMIITPTECDQFPTYCVYSGFCKVRSCEFMGQSQCLQNNCDWDATKKVCQIQLDCSQITTSDKCVIKKQQGIQCAWLTTTNNQIQCTVTGCRYLGSSQGDCMGTHIGNDVCVQMSDFSCVSCEEITDACICLNQSQYCSYDNLKKQCQSKSCQAHNSEDCPNTHCRFNSKNKICQPLCMYNYNQIQCNQADECIWNTTNNICISYTPEIVIIPVTLPNPDYASRLAQLFLVFMVILI